MFRRLFLAFSIFLTSLVVGLAVAVPFCAADGATQSRLWLALGVAFAAGLAAAAVVSWILARRVTRPVQALGRAIERLGMGGDRPQLFFADRDEVSTVGRAFNATSDRLGRHIAVLEEERQQLQTILSAMVEGVVALDSEQRVLFVNKRARELLELADPPPVGRFLWEAVRHRPLLDTVRQALASSEPHTDEFTWKGRTERNLTVQAARLAGNPTRGAVLVLHDTSELRRLERLRQEFVANVSHELKTPLSVIKVYAETLLDGAVEDEANRGRFLEQIVRQSDRLHALILDLLSLARLEAGNELFDFEAVPLDAAIQGCLERHRPRAATRSQRLSVAPPEQPVTAWADEEALAQILDNLLDNALKYTPEGGEITIRWGLSAGQAWVEVADTGIGIPEADLPRIFERFYRVDRARSRELGGTGLGLSIVKHLVGALHGGVRAASQPGKGTQFTVSLPVARAG